MQLIKNIINYSVACSLTWIVVHLFYYVRYYSLRKYTAKELIICEFQKYIGIYTLTVVLIFLLIALLLLYRHSRRILKLANDQADQIRTQAKIEIIEIKTNLTQREKFLETEYRRKNREKSIELEAIRKKLNILKKNQYDPRKRKKKHADQLQQLLESD